MSLFSPKAQKFPVTASQLSRRGNQTSLGGMTQESSKGFALVSSSLFNSKKLQQLAGNDQTPSLTQPQTTLSTYYGNLIKRESKVGVNGGNSSAMRDGHGSKLIPSSLDFKSTAQKLTEKRMRVSQIVSSKNSVS